VYALIVASLSDYQIRDINDDINRMMKEKYVWEVQLRNLGGPNYGVGIGGGKVFDDDGKEVAGQRGYKYYGRARELPGPRVHCHIGFLTCRGQGITGHC